MNYQKYNTLAQRAMKGEKAALVLKNAQIVNVFSEEIISGDIAIEGDRIVGVGNYNGKQEVDLQGAYVCPGFFDAHIHLESTLSAPRELLDLALRHGTTTFIVDPHEAANVAGVEGIQYIIDQTENADANVFIMIPSCVPSVPWEENGCILDAQKMKPFVNHPRVIGLGEVMDYVSVINAEPQMMEKLSLFSDKIIDGHAPNLNPYELAAYKMADIKTDHECVTFDYALEEVRSGMVVLIREGSGERNLEAIVTGILDHKLNTDRFAFCTDDKHLDDIKREGHIDYNVRKSIELGLNPVKAIKMATLNAAICYGITDKGAIAPGYQADLIIADALDDLTIRDVYCRGKLVAGKQSVKAPPCPESLLHTIHVPEITVADIALPVCQNQDADIIRIVDRQIITIHEKDSLPAENGFFVPSQKLNKAVVIERHKNTGQIGVGAVRGFNLQGGAIGTTFSHDSHNIIIIGDNDADILTVFQELKQVGGGYTVASGGEIVETLPLPIMGLMTDENNDAIDRILKTIVRRAHEMGIPDEVDPIATMSFLALPVIPDIRITTKGLYDVKEQRFL